MNQPNWQQSCRATLVVVTLCSWLFACGGGSSSSSTAVTDPLSSPQPERITLAGAGDIGIFDPSLARDPVTNRLWMSYSSVETSSFYPPAQYWAVSIRLAFSDDNGASWQDAGVQLAARAEQTVGPLLTGAATPPINVNSNGIWQSETSTLRYDPGAPAGERWKLLWFQYLHANQTSYFADYSWIALKMAATPLELATATPIKLFGGAGLQAANTIAGAPAFAPIAGDPAIQLNTNLTRSLGGADLTELTLCIFSEPGLHTTASAVYLAIYCADASTAPIITEYLVYFRCNSPCDITAATSWEYVGRLLTPADAAAAGAEHHYQAPALLQQDGKTYLLATPVDTSSGDRYSGCRVYELTDIDSNQLRRSGGVPVEIARVDGDVGTHHGACAAIAGVDGGILLSQFSADAPPQTFRIFKSQVVLP
jgi:hypothetical protein